jgi:Carboxypeptidase regulatory-like domain
MRPHRLSLGVVCTAIAIVATGCGTGAAGDRSGSASGPTGVLGAVVAGPQCPVEQVSDTTECSPKPIAATVLVVDPASGDTVGRTRTDEHGRFRIALPPGRYRLQANAGPGAGMHELSPQTDVVVTRGLTRTTLIVDTGIR